MKNKIIKMLEKLAILILGTLFFLFSLLYIVSPDVDEFGDALSLGDILSDILSK